MLSWPTNSNKVNFFNGLRISQNGDGFKYCFVPFSPNYIKILFYNDFILYFNI